MREAVWIKEVAGERGMTLLSIAKKLGVYRSNMSAIASGKRGISLGALKKLCCILDCSLDELVFSGKKRLVFKNKTARERLDLIEEANPDGTDKTWVNMVSLAGRHFRLAKKVR